MHKSHKTPIYSWNEYFLYISAAHKRIICSKFHQKLIPVLEKISSVLTPIHISKVRHKLFFLFHKNTFLSCLQQYREILIRPREKNVGFPLTWPTLFQPNPGFFFFFFLFFYLWRNYTWKMGSIPRKKNLKKKKKRIPDRPTLQILVPLVETRYLFFLA